MPSVIKRIRQYNAALPAHLHTLKWEALSESPFRFFRGTCHLFAADFMKLYKGKTHVKTWICGDLHFENFGSYKGENRLVYFDMNDFDEAILATPEPEITRFLSSIVIAGLQMKASEKSINATLHEVVTVYANTLIKGKALMMESEVAYGILRKYFDKLNKRDRTSFIEKHLVKQRGKSLLNADGIHFLPLAANTKKELFRSVKNLLKDNEHFANMQYVDAAFRIAGTGSLGLQRYCVLCYNSIREKHYLIDIKEARTSCYKGLVTLKQPKFKNEAERIIMAGYMMQFNSPAFMTPLKIEDNWYVVRELQATADKLSINEFKNDFSAFREVALDMATLLGYGHIRSSGHMGSSTADELMRFADKHQWQKDVIELGITLADNSNKYYNTFLKSEKVKDKLLIH